MPSEATQWQQQPRSLQGQDSAAAMPGHATAPESLQALYLLSLQQVLKVRTCCLLRVIARRSAARQLSHPPTEAAEPSLRQCVNALIVGTSVFAVKHKVMSSASWEQSIPILCSNQIVVLFFVFLLPVGLKRAMFVKHIIS